MGLDSAEMIHIDFEWEYEDQLEMDLTSANFSVTDVIYIVLDLNVVI